MTTTPDYIKKCEMAEEIQAMRAPKNGVGDYELEHGDWFAAYGKALYTDKDSDWEIEVYGTTEYPPARYEGSNRQNNVSCGGVCEGAGYDAEIIVWLPRLDQLCEILCDDGKTTGFSGWVINSVNFKHAEEMYLDDVMQTKFGKKWDGEKWIQK